MPFEPAFNLLIIGFSQSRWLDVCSFHLFWVSDDNSVFNLWGPSCISAHNVFYVSENVFSFSKRLNHTLKIVFSSSAV